MLLSDKYPLLTDYFEKAINLPDGKLSHSILLYGNDSNSQYEMALEIARMLNCKGDRSSDCQCLNCKWLRENKHPAVLTFSTKDNKPEDDTSRTVISVKQSEYIRNSIITSSEFHRVFIFCDRDDDGNILGLNKFNFPVATANSMLKSIEEPPEKVTFIFLTRDKDDLISTIVSRSQAFFMPTKNRESYNYELIEPVFKNYWEINRSNAFDISEKLNNLAKENSPTDILVQIQNYMLTVLKSNPKQRFLIDDLKIVEQMKKEVAIGMKNDTVFDDLCLKIIR